MATHEALATVRIAYLLSGFLALPSLKCGMSGGFLSLARVSLRAVAFPPFLPSSTAAGFFLRLTTLFVHVLTRY